MDSDHFQNVFSLLFSAKSYLTLRDPVGYSMAVSPVLHCPQEFAQIHVHWVGDAI